MGAFLRKYATATHLYLPIVKRAVVDFAVNADWTPAAGDVKVSIDGGAAANIGTLPTAIAMGNGAIWDFTIASGETTGKKITITVSDSATKAVEDQCFVIETYGHASAEYPPDFSDAVRMGLTALPNAAADAAGGLPISDAGGLDLDAQRSDVAAILVDTGTTLDGKIDAVDNFIDTEIADIQARLPAALTAGGNMKCDALALSGDTTAADNAEAFFDGTGYAGTNNVIPTVTTLTNDPSGVTTLLSRLSSARAGYLDNINNSNLATVPAFPSNFASLGINVSGHLSRVTLVDTTTTNTDMLTAAGIRTAVGLASANLDTQLAAIDDAIDTEVAAILAAVDTEVAAIQTAVVTTIPATLAALFTTALTESYRTAGATGSVAQLLYELIGGVLDHSISGTTKSIRNLAGSAAKTYTLDSATVPTSITEAT